VCYLGSHFTITEKSEGALQVGGENIPVKEFLAQSERFEGQEERGWAKVTEAIGEYGRTVNGLANAGRVVVAKGLSTGLDFTGTNGRILTEDSGGSGVVQANDRFGFALAAGEFGTSDGYDDVAIGAPGDGLGVTANAGQLQIFPGGPSGPNGSGWSGFNQGSCNDPVASGDEFGWSVAFGRFDATDRGGFATGAPFEDWGGGWLSLVDAGQVHVIAPWRQVFGLTSRTGVMGTCFGELLFSVRPFDWAYIASTTKIMTILLACEHVQAGLDPNTPYTVPLWVASDVFVEPSNCLPPLVTGETVTLIDLMYLCLRHSGNDAAFAIADILYGGGGQSSFNQYVTNSVAFVNEMNARAAQLGMTGTHFTNPPGFDWPHFWLPTGNNHYSTAYDMWLLGKVAIANPLFAQICGLLPYNSSRQGPVAAGYASVFNSPLVIGLKDGQTDKALFTGVFAAKVSNGPAKAVGSLMGSPTSQLHINEPIAMINMALAQCANPQVIGDPGAFRFTLSNVLTRIDTRSLAGSEFGSSVEDNMELDLFRQSGSQPTAVHLELGRQSELVLDPGASVPFGIGPFESHLGYEIANLDSFAHQIRLAFPGGVASDYTIEPDSVVVTPPYSTGGTGQLPSYTVILENTGGESAYLSVHERYAFDVMNIGPPAAGPAMSLQLRRVGFLHDGFWVATKGLDPSSELNEVFIAVHDPGAPVGVRDLPGPEAGAATLRLLPATPNPSKGRTRIGLELARQASVGLDIHDLQGRVVRRIPERLLSPGRWDIEWDGVADDGRPVRSGLYFYRATLDRRPGGSGTIVMTR
jgi:D-alanyl-D-alanine carboxypeptidase